MSRQQILLEAAELEPGERKRIVCPTCGGGTTRERSLSVGRTDDGAPIWNCFRGSCPERGGGEARASLVRTRHTPKRTTVKPYQGELRFCEDAELAFLAERIGWHEPHWELGRPFYAPEDDRYAFPILGPLAARRGYVLRAYDGREPKALTRMEVDEPHMSWYRRPSVEGTIVVVVEDIPSAVRAGLYAPAVALCGTGVSADYAAEIAGLYPRVVWALDADATALALQLKREHSLLFNESRVLVLEKDIKDMEEEEVKQLMEDLVLDQPRES